MTITGVDTMIFIYAMKRAGESSPPEALELRRRTVVLLDNLRKEGAILVVPTVTIWEVLTGIFLSPSEYAGGCPSRENGRQHPGK